MDLNLYQKQFDYFYGSETKYNTLDKGRRTGFTHGSAIYCQLEGLLQKEYRFLWVDTVYSNIDRYVERYFLPTLKQMPNNLWSWAPSKKEMKIGHCVYDFRSADRPENMEGFGYHRVILNEAGIILKGDKGRALWSNSILPMTLDYADCQVFIGGTPKGRRGKDGKISLFTEMCTRNHKNWTHSHINTDENPHLTNEAVEEVREELPEGPIRDQEFYGKHVDSVSGIIKDFWFQIDETPLYGETVRSWDLAFTVKKANDFYAGVKMSRDETKYQILDVKHGKLTWPELKLEIMSTAELDGPDVVVVIEEAGQQVGYVDDISAEPRMANYTIVGQAPKGDKLVRCMKWASRLKRGQVTLLRGDWNEGFITEGCSFSNDDSHAHDDRLDGASGAYQYFNSEHIGVCYV